MFGRTDHAQGTEVILIHRQDVIKLLEIAARYLPRPLTAQIYPATQRHRLSPRVGGITDVIRMGARGIDFDLVIQAGLFYQALENALGGRGTANIAHANKQYLYHPITPRSFLPVNSCAPVV